MYTFLRCTQWISW